MTVETPAQDLQARVTLELILGGKDRVAERTAYTETSEFAELSEVGQLTHKLVTATLSKALVSMVDQLRKDVGIEDEQDAPDEQLAEVIELFDGNRRQGRLP